MFQDFVTVFNLLIAATTAISWQKPTAETLSKTPLPATCNETLDLETPEPYSTSHRSIDLADFLFYCD